MAVEPTCYRVADLAEHWSCSPSKIRTLLRDGVLPTLQLGTMIRLNVSQNEARQGKSGEPLCAVQQKAKLSRALPDHSIMGKRALAMNRLIQVSQLLKRVHDVAAFS